VISVTGRATRRASLRRCGRYRCTGGCSDTAVEEAEVELKRTRNGQRNREAIESSTGYVQVPGRTEREFADYQAFRDSVCMNCFVGTVVDDAGVVVVVVVVEAH